MLKILNHFKANYLFYLTVFSLASGVYFFNEFNFLGNLVNWFLAGIFFLSAFTIDVEAIKNEAKKVLKISWFLLVSFGVIPFLVYFALSFIDNKIMVAMVLLASMPPGLTSPTVAGILGGKKSLALVLTIISSFLAPIFIPIILSLTIKEQISFDFWEMAGQIALLTILPFIVGSLLKKATPKISSLVKPIVQKTSIILLALIIVGVIAKTTALYGQEIFYSPANLLILVKMTIFFALVHIGGWYLFFKNDKPHRISMMASLAYMNFTLALTLAERFFPAPEVIIPLVLSIIPWSIGISIAKQKLAK